jgi:hypothetical protein
MPQGGAILIASGLLNEESPGLDLAVADTGRGIDADALG